jgi:type VI protein secretion system component Hcp
VPVSPRLFMVVAGLVVLALPVAAHAAAYLKLGDIKGEAVQTTRADAATKRAHKGHKDEIEVHSFSWGATNSGASARVIAPRDAASGLPTGKRQHRPVTFTRPLDRNPGTVTVQASLPDCRVGTVYSTVELGDSTTREAVRLHDAAVSACAAEQVSFNYTKIEW